MKKLLVILLVLKSLIYSCQQNTRLDIPPQYVSQVQTSSIEKTRLLVMKKQWRNVEDYLPSNYVKDASVDYTEFIQRAINENIDLIFPDFPLLINEKGLSFHSNMSVYFEEKSLIKIKPNAKSQYEILRLHDVENIKLYYPKIQGDKYAHTAKEGEWGMGISIRGTKNIEIVGAEVSQCWGDGIYLGVTSENKRNIDVVIKNTILDDNRRNGMSIISAENLLVKNILVANTFGTSPTAAIDIEPNLNTDIIGKLHFKNIKTFNNNMFGFLFAVGHLSGDYLQTVDITIDGLESVRTNYGLALKMGQDKTKRYTPKGNIRISNFTAKEIRIKEILSYDENKNNTINTEIILNKKNANYTKYRNYINNAENIKVRIKK